jgi:hypothetical protein
MQNSDAIRPTPVGAYLKPSFRRSVTSRAESGAGGGEEDQCFAHGGRRNGRRRLWGGGASAFVGDFGCHVVYLMLLLTGQVGDLWWSMCRYFVLVLSQFRNLWQELPCIISCSPSCQHCSDLASKHSNKMWKDTIQRNSGHKRLKIQDVFLFCTFGFTEWSILRMGCEIPLEMTCFLRKILTVLILAYGAVAYHTMTLHDRWKSILAYHTFQVFVSFSIFSVQIRDRWHRNPDGVFRVWHLFSNLVWPMRIAGKCRFQRVSYSIRCRQHFIEVYVELRKLAKKKLK